MGKKIEKKKGQLLVKLPFWVEFAWYEHCGKVADECRWLDTTEKTWESFVTVESLHGHWWAGWRETGK